MNIDGGVLALFSKSDEAERMDLKCIFHYHYKSEILFYRISCASFQPNHSGQYDIFDKIHFQAPTSYLGVISLQFSMFSYG